MIGKIAITVAQMVSDKTVFLIRRMMSGADRRDQRHLREDGVGEQAHLDDLALHEQKRDERPQDDRDQERLEGDDERCRERMDQNRPLLHESNRDFTRGREQVWGHVRRPAHPLPDDEHQDADERGRDRPQHGTRPERAQSSIPLTDEASLRIAESSRHRSAKCELVRNALARGSGSSTMNSRNTRPGCEVITMMRVEKEHRLIEQVGNEHRRQVTFPREAQQVVVEPVARELIERTERLVHQHTSGSVTRARAIETRMRMPPESWRG